MKKSAFVLVAVALLFAAALALAAVEPAAPARAPEAAAQAPASPLLATDLDRASYSFGVRTVRGLKGQGLEVAPAAFLQGVSDSLNNARPLMTEQEMAAAIKQTNVLIAARVQKMLAAAGETLKRGQAFLAENAKKEGVVTLPSGLQYRVIVAGSGPSPTLNDTVVVAYRGRLIDGTEFDSSYARGEAAQFKVGGVIKGWQEGLKLMNKGAKWQLFIPADLAYGVQGKLPVIGPNEVLVFDVELLEIRIGIKLNPQE